MTGICESEDRTWLDIIDLDLVPRVIENGGRLYLGFVHDGEENPPKYYEFILPSVKLGTLEVRGTEPKMPKDSVHKISPFSYFLENWTMRQWGKTDRNSKFLFSPFMCDHLPLLNL